MSSSLVRARSAAAATASSASASAALTDARHVVPDGSTPSGTCTRARQTVVADARAERAELLYVRAGGRADVPGRHRVA
ncbi:hypothetical protein F4560_003010 [Saccharothrix ecbatanensis]|uniref:Secreted protein n=1 Tax=Saccharothrix ecbatanensis TaxID=1105145 RepID=A0A7W9HJ40_9PSEU|nr:hypothetical protein [Saccharothrix ecbatanensis]MBB5803242.1 hypothetical protein [Saccharothrix ecbatanensis]